MEIQTQLLKQIRKYGRDLKVLRAEISAMIEELKNEECEQNREFLMLEIGSLNRKLRKCLAFLQSSAQAYRRLKEGCINN